MNHRRRRTQEQFEFSVVYSSVAVLLCAIKGIAANAVAGLLPLVWNLRTVSGFAVLQVQNRLLTKEDEKLPFAQHRVSLRQHFDFI